MSSQRINIGLLVPSVNTIVEPDMYSMAPKGVAFITSRLLVPTVDLSEEGVHENLDAIAQAVDESIQLLPSKELTGIAFCCNAASFFRGGQWDRELAGHIEKLTDTPAVTTSGASIAGLSHLGVRRVSIASPYVDSVNKELSLFMEANRPSAR